MLVVFLSPPSSSFRGFRPSTRYLRTPSSLPMPISSPSPIGASCTPDRPPRTNDRGAIRPLLPLPRQSPPTRGNWTPYCDRAHPFLGIQILPSGQGDRLIRIDAHKYRTRGGVNIVAAIAHAQCLEQTRLGHVGKVKDVGNPRIILRRRQRDELVAITDLVQLSIGRFDLVSVRGPEEMALKAASTVS